MTILYLSKVFEKKNKAFEFQVDLFKPNIDFGFSFRWFFKTDHSGPRLHFSFFFFFIDIIYYDTRHFCDECNKFADETCYKEDHFGYSDYKDFLEKEE